MNKKTIAIFAVSMVLVCALSVFTTLALLTSQTDVVTNTFTSGNVTITLDETAVGENGKFDTNAAAPVKENTYKFLPAAVYDKDPTIHVANNSENCYVAAIVEFVNVPAMSASDLIEAYNIDASMEADADYYELSDITTTPVQVTVDGNETSANLYSGKYVIYYKSAKAAATNLKLFQAITVPNVGSADLAAVTSTNNSTIKVTGYAVQSNNNDAATGEDPALAALQSAFTVLTPAA